MLKFSPFIIHFSLIFHILNDFHLKIGHYIFVSWARNKTAVIGAFTLYEPMNEPATDKCQKKIPYLLNTQHMLSWYTCHFLCVLTYYFINFILLLTYFLSLAFFKPGILLLFI